MTLKPGQKAPAIKLPDQDGKVHQLKDYMGQWVLVYFYPKDDTTFYYSHNFSWPPQQITGTTTKLSDLSSPQEYNPSLIQSQPNAKVKEEPKKALFQFDQPVGDTVYQIHVQLMPHLKDGNS